MKAKNKKNAAKLQAYSLQPKSPNPNPNRAQTGREKYEPQDTRGIHFKGPGTYEGQYWEKNSLPLEVTSTPLRPDIIL